MTMLRKITPTFAALALVAIAMSFRSTPDKKTFDEKDFDSVLGEKIAVMEPLDLARFIKNQTNAYWLIDLRDTASFNTYHIPTAINVSVNSVTALPAQINEDIFLYTEHEREAVQAYELLYFRGYFNVKVVAGGIGLWKSRVLFPDRSGIPPEQINEREELAVFFGGQVTEGGAPASLQIQPVKIKSKTARDGC